MLNSYDFFCGFMGWSLSKWIIENDQVGKFRKIVYDGCVDRETTMFNQMEGSELRPGIGE